MPRRRITSVTTPKKPSKEPSLPSQDESRRTNVLFEKLISDFRTVGESLSLVREDVNSLKPRFDKLEQKVDVLESAVRTNGKDISALKDAVQGNTQAIRSLKDAVQGNTEAIRSMQTDLKYYNQRLEVVETKLAS